MGESFRLTNGCSNVLTSQSFDEAHALDASLLLNDADLKYGETRYNGQPFYFSVGAAKQRETQNAGKVILPMPIMGVVESDSKREWEWSHFINLKALPEGFMPVENVKFRCFLFCDFVWKCGCL